MLIKKIDEIKLCDNLEINDAGFFLKKFDDKNSQLTLILNSIVVEFIFPDLTNIEPILFNIPFSLLSIFYFNHPEDVKYLITFLFEFNEEFDRIKINYENMRKFIIFSDKFNTKKMNYMEHSKNHFHSNIYIYKWITPKYKLNVKIR